MPLFAKNLLALPPRTKGVLAVTAVAILAIVFFMLKLATAPSYSLLSSGLDPAQTGKITAALDSQGIAYELRNNGTALAVNKAQVPQARIALASQGVSVNESGSQPGYELLDQTKLGTSQFQQQVTYQRALEGELARTINGVEGVSGASVQLVLPEDTLFASEQSPATASVMMQNTADTLQPGAIRGIAQLTASSVKGLKSGNVTITDGSGQLLWPQGDGSAGATAGATKQATEASFSRQLESKVNAMLASTLGPGKAQVQVSADMNVDKTNLKQLTYGKTGVPTKSTSDVEKLRGSGATTGGTAGTGSNVPTYSNGSGSGSGNSNYDHTVKTTEQAVNKEIKTTDVAPGAINKLSVALLVDKSVPAATLNSLKQTVAAAAGIQPSRGDTIVASQMAFAKPATPKTGPVPTTLLGPLKWVGLGIAALLFVFFMARGLRKREAESLGTPAWLKQIEEPISLAQLEQSTVAMAPSGLPPRVPDASLHQLDQLMEREPERVAAQVRQWMAAD
ncbi:flagellar basal-body MS-ring/collar protein FliF [Candidatus Solirubrobacter pratensis]|uniref:flagellar basal-body MS-ring/collar protein FliF n=1 Tax=Candidatus Solirubrobacter pratensis TaxID=1298857 RepID=UPI0004003896|nr:flagellar basal-body MS-ring/collar protein FliF [Candidatus Solirubrobacter pratensis]